MSNDSLLPRSIQTWSQTICLCLFCTLLVSSGCKSSFPELTNPFAGKRSQFGSDDVLTADNASRFKPSALGNHSGETSSTDSGLDARQVSYNQPIVSNSWYESFDEAESVAKNSELPMLVMFTGSDWCSWCVRLKKDVFDTPEFKTWAEGRVVLVELDFPRNPELQPAMAVKLKNEELKRRFQVRGFPTVVILDADGKSLGTLGYMKTPDEWIAAANAMLK